LISASKFTIAPSTSGTVLRPVICLGATGSSHTVCHIPVTGVYQIPSGLLTCFPLGWGPSLLGSQTFTTSFWEAPLRKGVISKENGAYPPVWDPILTSFNHTSAFQSTAPKCRRMFLPSHPSGTSKEVSYQTSLEEPTS